ncbi:MAG: alpha/beta hydrolase [Acidobacteriia bacterium]|nr:alpha/beta hydrolase [Terriglobia bacterium]
MRVLIGLLLLTGALAWSEKRVDIVYATVDGVALKLDLYLPAAAKAPLLVYVHGGAWRSGSKDRIPLGDLVGEGYAIASVGYRLSPVARFPAQIHDLKAAIRFLRASEKVYGYDARRIAITGSSAGAHLATLVGVTNGHRDLEGRLGEHLDQSSDVQAIVSFFGASNLLTILSQSTERGVAMRAPALQLLLGGQPAENPVIAKLASPVFHVDARDPPLFLLHGDQDPQMPIEQSQEMQTKYREMGLPVQFEVVQGAGHGGAQFFDARRMRLVVEFLGKSLVNGPQGQRGH